MGGGLPVHHDDAAFLDCLPKRARNLRVCPATATGTFASNVGVLLMVKVCSHSRPSSFIRRRKHGEQARPILGRWKSHKPQECSFADSLGSALAAALGFQFRKEDRQRSGRSMGQHVHRRARLVADGFLEGLEAWVCFGSLQFCVCFPALVILALEDPLRAWDR